MPRHAGMTTQWDTYRVEMSPGERSVSICWLAALPEDAGCRVDFILLIRLSDLARTIRGDCLSPGRTANTAARSWFIRTRQVERCRRSKANSGTANKMRRCAIIKLARQQPRKWSNIKARRLPEKAIRASAA